ncbi:MAG: hypothetical protein P8I74_08515, partial [Phycisphaerales bacterium]|nr:hypothetical protein [Phycisphaerales bacterium]
MTTFVAGLLGASLLFAVTPSTDQVLEEPVPEKESDSPDSLVQVPGIERVVRIDDRLLVGSEPSADSIEHLHQLGVTVLLSVDARRPRLEEARRLGMRVVHLPIGY